MLNQKEEALVISFLKEFSDRLSCDGCNDWNFPDGWSPVAKENFVKEFYAWNGDPENFDPKRLHLDNACVVKFLAHRMTQNKHDYLIKVKRPADNWIAGYLTETQCDKFKKWAASKDGPFEIEFSFTGIGVGVKSFCVLLTHVVFNDKYTKTIDKLSFVI